MLLFRWQLFQVSHGLMPKRAFKIGIEGVQHRFQHKVEWTRAAGDCRHGDVKACQKYHTRLLHLWHHDSNMKRILGYYLHTAPFRNTSVCYYPLTITPPAHAHISITLQLHVVKHQIQQCPVGRRLNNPS